MTETRKKRKTEGHQGGDKCNDHEADLEVESVVGIAPEDSTEAIEEVLNDGDIGVEVIIIDEGQAECFAVC